MINDYVILTQSSPYYSWFQIYVEFEKKIWAQGPQKQMT